MKITNVRACQPVTPQSPPDWRTDLGQILVAVDTDKGLTGYGVGGGGWAGIHVVQTVLRELLLGQSPADISTLWQQMYDTTLAYGQKGLALMAISGVDLALWDLRGKAADCAVYDLLGGLQHASMPTYVTVWSRDALEAAADAGHQGVKLHLEQFAPHDLDDDDYADVMAEQLSWARQKLPPHVELMADAWMRWSFPIATAVLDRVAPLQLSWLEEPLPLDQEDDYAALTARGDTPIAGGEHEYTAAAFAHIAKRKLHDVLQPDVCWCGGLSELLKVYELGRIHNLRVTPHRGSEIWSLPALAAIDPAPLAESGRSWMSWVKGQPPIVDGKISPPPGPGFGLQLDESKLDTLPPPRSRWSR